MLIFNCAFLSDIETSRNAYSLVTEKNMDLIKHFTLSFKSKCARITAAEETSASETLEAEIDYNSIL